ncbi:filamentous hemagglutinin N-terminal domain-containing protein [Candidatus Methylacidiphilum infernorum]|uniref:Predicted exoprotein contaning haemagglutination activity domain n=1 Tax=Methylacidiphilum infernorum (isolate V4) TaxID=481448 RepID=B3DZ23_METI4|nr:filamentous hemagglutinin N-terminal domain-containing protein [Candidatus Methylacidiphilum infernorum]ACD84115.1 Predicted exoprotein contaning haemagglutination activity domain [Methylacidiphilum infernorum V4]
MHKKFLKKLRKWIFASLFLGFSALYSQKLLAFVPPPLPPPPAPNQLPGHGQVITGAATLNPPGNTLQVESQFTSIMWGGPSYNLNPNQPAGFNVGAQAHFGIVKNFPGPSVAALLNVDVSGNPSQVYGNITVAGDVIFFLANGSGIIVGPSGTINAPAGIGLFGYSINPSNFGGSVSIAKDSPGSFVTVMNGATLRSEKPGAMILIAAPQSVNIAALKGEPGDGGIVAKGGVSLVAGYALSGYNGYGFTVPSNGAFSVPASLNIHGSTDEQPFVISTALSNGNIWITGGSVVLPPTGAPGFGSLVWSTTLVNDATVAFSGPLSIANRQYSGSLYNYGSIVSFDEQPIVINVNGSIVNYGIINGGELNEDADQNVTLQAWQGGVANFGTINGHDTIVIAATNPSGTGTFPKGGVFSNGTISFSAEDTPTTLIFRSATGPGYLGGTVNYASQMGITNAFLGSGFSPGFPFELATNLTAQNVSFNGGSLVGGGILSVQSIDLTLSGNVNHVVSTNPLLNGFQLANGPFPSTNITINADGTGPQFINIAVSGNAVVNSGNSSTFMQQVMVNGVQGLTLPVPNAGGNLLLNVSGNLTVNPGSPSQFAMSRDILSFPGFVFPGGIAMKAGGSLTVNASLDNGYSPSAGTNYQGIFLSSPFLSVGYPFVTNGNTRVTVSSPVNEGVYAVSPISSSNPTVYTVVLNPSALVVGPFPWSP